ncbi:MAG: hypothetical protein N2253_07950 [Bacteroidia bacterium]|nr:hypothetical protein [Bacteroidia bacterium]MCX7764806.1 hypothetical protein [Bacteroidia bacterium]MDW8057334.1 hypothetical protein [Bacteroidia bacterium]
MRRWLIGLLLLPLVGWAQCAMCRKNAENANPGLAKGLRIGIIFLFAVPYIVAGTVGWLWYKRMRESGRLGAGHRDSGKGPSVGAA